MEEGWNAAEVDENEFQVHIIWVLLLLMTSRPLAISWWWKRNIKRSWKKWRMTRPSMKIYGRTGSTKCTSNTRTTQRNTCSRMRTLTWIPTTLLKRPSSWSLRAGTRMPSSLWRPVSRRTRTTPRVGGSLVNYTKKTTKTSNRSPAYW